MKPIGYEEHGELLKEFEKEIGKIVESKEELKDLIDEYRSKLPKQLTQLTTGYIIQYDAVTEIMLYSELDAMEIKTIEDFPDKDNHNQEFQNWKNSIQHNNVQLEPKFELKKFWDNNNWEFKGNEESCSVGIGDIIGVKDDGTTIIGEAGPCRIDKPVEINEDQELHHLNTRLNKIFIYKPKEKYSEFKERSKEVEMESLKEAVNSVSLSNT